MEQNLFGKHNVFITGGSGLIGSNLIVYLLEKNTQVVVFVRSESAKQKTIQLIHEINNSIDVTSISWKFGSISDYDLLLTAMQDCKYVFHCAGMVSFQNSQAQALYDTNVIGTQNVVEACLQLHVTKLCYVSSVAAIGKSIHSKEITEECEFEITLKTNWYHRSKYEGELEVWRGIAEGLNAVIVNPTVVLGAGDWNQSSSAIFKSVFKGMPFYTSGSTGYVSAKDVVRCMVLLLQSDISNERFILNAVNCNFKTIFSLIAKALDKKAPQISVPKWLLWIVIMFSSMIQAITRKPSTMGFHMLKTAYGHSLYSNTKICNQLQFTFTPLENTIEELGAYYIQKHNHKIKK